MAEEESFTGTSLTSLQEALDSAWSQVPGDPDREGSRAATISRMWMTGGGVVGTEHNVELTTAAQPADRSSASA